MAVGMLQGAILANTTEHVVQHRLPTPAGQQPAPAASHSNKRKAPAGKVVSYSVS